MNDRDYIDVIRETFLPGDYSVAETNRVLYMMVGLAGEAGEIANMAQKAMRGDFNLNELRMFPPRREKLIGEMGGVFWFLYGLCDAIGIDPADVRELNAETLLSRKERGTLMGDGDER